MIEWENIPITVRCTCREKIDPNYPSNFWQFEPKGNPYGQVSVHQGAETRSKYAQPIIDLLTQGEATVSELARHLGVRPVAISSLLGGLSHTLLIYEYQRDGRKYIGLLDGAS